VDEVRARLDITGLTVGGGAVTITRHTLDGTDRIATFTPTVATKTYLDWRLPLNEDVYWTIRQGVQPLAVSASVRIDAVRGWLQSAILPDLYKVPVTIVDDLDLDWEQAGTIHTVIGSRLPIPVTDVRLVRRGTMRLYVEGYSEWDALREVIETGHTVTIRPCDRRVIENGNLYVQSFQSSWVAKAGGNRIADLVYQQVDYITEPDIALNAVTFQAVKDAYPASADPAVAGGFDKVRLDHQAPDGFLRLMYLLPAGSPFPRLPGPTNPGGVRLGW
jgi:hypothetical protein